MRLAFSDSQTHAHRYRLSDALPDYRAGTNQYAGANHHAGSYANTNSQANPDTIAHRMYSRPWRPASTGCGYRLVRD
jgi:hypothetical protein